MFTPIQRADRLIGGHDLERLTEKCKRQKSINTKTLLVELKRIRKLLARHGEEMRNLHYEVRRHKD